MNSDLISREALKKDFEERNKACDKWIAKAKDEETKIRAEAVKSFICEVIMTIDNAPSVEPVFSTTKVNISEEIKQKIIEELQKPHKLLVLPEPEVAFERPQGEWIKWNFKTFGALGDWEYRCSNCEKVYSGEYNFCPNCGAKMRKGGAE